VDDGPMTQSRRLSEQLACLAPPRVLRILVHPDPVELIASNQLQPRGHSLAKPLGLRTRRTAVSNDCSWTEWRRRAGNVPYKRRPTEAKDGDERRTATPVGARW